MQLKHFVRRTFVPILNIIGMSISLMVFLVLFAQVWFDYRFNRNFEDYENIYRLLKSSKIPLGVTLTKLK